MYETIDSRLRSAFYDNPAVAQLLTKLEQGVLDNRLSSFIAAREALDFYENLRTER